MSLKNLLPELEVPNENPFKNDQLGRENIGEKLTDFLKNTDESIVISIDAEWGQGKTTFLRMWRQMLINEGFVTLYYSAWENDYNNDALITIIGEIEEEADKLISGEGNKKQKVNQILQQTKKAGGNILANSIPFMIKILTSGLIDLKDIEEDIGDLAKELATKQVENYKKSKNEVIEFRKTLTKLAKELSNSDETKPLIIFVDELDRCRPTFAIEVLERIKHLFLTPNIIFVLAIDKIQLIESMKTVYGANLNSSGYLKRFIDIEFSLPIPDTERYTRALIDSYGISRYLDNTEVNLNRNDANQIVENIIELIDYFDCTLREVEKCYSKIIYAFKITNSNYDLYPIEVSFLILLSIKHYSIFKHFKNSKIDVDQLFDELEKRSTKLEDFSHSVKGARVWNKLFVIDNNLHEIEDKQNSLTNLIENNSNLSERKKKQFTYRLNELNPNIIYRSGDRRYVMQVIEMVTYFK